MQRTKVARLILAVFGSILLFVVLAPLFLRSRAQPNAWRSQIPMMLTYAAVAAKAEWEDGASGGLVTHLDEARILKLLDPKSKPRSGLEPHVYSRMSFAVRNGMRFSTNPACLGKKVSAIPKDGQILLLTSPKDYGAAGVTKDLYIVWHGELSHP